MPGWMFRDAQAGDEPAVQRVVFTVLREYGLGPDPENFDADLKDITVSYKVPGGCFRVLVDSNGAIVGCGGLMRLDCRIAEIRKMYLLPLARGRGHGRALLNYLIDFACTRGCERLVLDTASVLKDAIALYQRAGFIREPLPAHLPPRCDQGYFLPLASPFIPAEA